MTNKLNPIEKFNHFFEKLTEEEQKELYDLFGVLRGPDEKEEYRFKSALTTRVRTLLGINKGCNYTVRERHRHRYPGVDSLPFYELTLNECLKEFSGSHYSEHAIDCIVTLVKYKYVDKSVLNGVKV